MGTSRKTAEGCDPVIYVTFKNQWSYLYILCMFPYYVLCFLYWKSYRVFYPLDVNKKNEMNVVVMCEFLKQYVFVSDTYKTDVNIAIFQFSFKFFELIPFSLSGSRNVSSAVKIKNLFSFTTRNFINL